MGTSINIGTQTRVFYSWHIKQSKASDVVSYRLHRSTMPLTILITRNQLSYSTYVSPNIQFDKKFATKNPNFFQYDFNHPELIPEKYHNYFDFVLADPPFITLEVWQKYAEAIRKIIKKVIETFL